LEDGGEVTIINGLINPFYFFYLVIIGDVLNKLFVMCLALFALLFIFGCTSSQNVSVVDANSVNVEVRLIDFSGVLVLGKNINSNLGVNAFDLMKSNFDVNYIDYPTGPFVTNVNNLDFNKDYYLALYVDGNYADKGINGYTINKNMLIEWKVESLSAFGLS